MACEAHYSYDNSPWRGYGKVVSESGHLELEDRADPVAPLTLLSRDPATGYLVPFSDARAVDGTEKPIGFTDGERTYTAVEVDAGIDIVFLRGESVKINIASLVCEAGDVLTTEIASENELIVDYLKKIGIEVVTMNNTATYGESEAV